MKITKECIQRVNESFSEEAIRIMRKRYLLENENPAEMFKRVAIALNEVNEHYDNGKNHAREYFEIMTEKKFIPAGRTLTNAGTETPIVPNCVVLPIHDDMGHDDGGIFNTLRDAAILQQAGCGLGFDFSELRPANYDTKKSRGKASGPVSFLMVYDHAFSTIKQQGRHGANMAMLRVDHPDILDFITCKEREGDIANFNISVTVTYDFMQQVKDSPSNVWMCKFNDIEVSPRKIVRDGTKIISVEDNPITVGDLFQLLVNSAWGNGEPGIAFIDTVNETNPLPGLGNIAVSNPCGEQFLHPYDNCNLGSINLGQFVQYVGTNPYFDYDELRSVVRLATEMLDNVIDLMDSPLEIINLVAKDNRRIGLGIMGWADTLSKLGIRYGSDKSFELAKNIAQSIKITSRLKSSELAKERGNFLNIDESVFPDSMRNAALTTVAPTGSISKLFDCSSGIEPHFALNYTFTDKDDEKYLYRNQDLINSLKREGWEIGEIYELLDLLMDGLGKVNGINEKKLSQEIKDAFVTTMDISPLSHLNMQFAWQQYIDNSISKTVNLPNSATLEDVKDIMIKAWTLKLKSITVYRDGSRNKQVLTIGSSDSVKESIDLPIIVNNMLDIHHHEELELPDVLLSHRWRVRTSHGNMYVQIPIIRVNGNNIPIELFAQLGKPGQCRYADLEAQARLISLSLRSGVPPGIIANQLIGITCHTSFHEGNTILSVADGMGQVLKKYEEKGSADKWTAQLIQGLELSIDTDQLLIDPNSEIPETIEEIIPDSINYLSEPCNDCGVSMVQIISGCKECKNCGHNTCG
jgi:ribonucleoside-diphosphate reductase alpha chain